MPFTLAYSAVILPICHSRYWHKPALILGSMSPDFVYFLHGQASGDQGHTWWGFILLNLPLCGIIYWLYQRFICPYFWQNLPVFLQISPSKNLAPFTSFTAVIFSTSAFFGMLTHVLLDSFTHPAGWFVLNFPIFQQVFFGLVCYKWLQYIGGILGLAVILVYWIYSAKAHLLKSNVAKKVKFRYWFSVSLLTTILLSLWQLLAPIGFTLLVNWVIRGIDCEFLALAWVGVWLNYTQKKGSLY